MLRQVIAMLIVSGLGIAAWAQSPLDQLPEWAQPRVRALSDGSALDVSTRLNPFVWRGDFDGDGRQDLALLVRARSSGKEGVAFLLRAQSAPSIVGAGNDFGHGGDDFAWLDQWSVEEARDAAPADRLIVAKAESASAVIYFKSGQPVWQQRGD